MNKKLLISQSIMWAAAILVVSIVDEKEFAIFMLVILATVSLMNLRKGKWEEQYYYSLFQYIPLRWSRFGCTPFWGLKMKFNISLKTLVLIQGVLIIGTVAIKIFYEWVGVEHILPLYSVLWIATWLEVSKNTK